MAIGLHAAMHFSLELFLTAHAVRRDSISEGKDRTRRLTRCSGPTKDGASHLPSATAVPAGESIHRPGQTSCPPTISGRPSSLVQDPRLGKRVVSSSPRLFSQSEDAPFYRCLKQEIPRPFGSPNNLLPPQHTTLNQETSLMARTRAKPGRQRGQTTDGHAGRE